ncbi:hypothetical protein EDB29_101459 [Vibrio crassostreae]|uniref:hypothetical protein n=1 Tax=Vibrio crassostreae TaxID=246167 RepID=UPI00104EEA5C|nr:hypothetical protein [Vibrio crassostreae]TCT43652.1 hypothetical protein EDB29_101459 [Vibrio crassostreae]
MDTSNIVAWWGAVVATLVLGWDVLKWLKSGAKIKTRLVLRVQYSDSEPIRQAQTENGLVSIYETYTHIEVINVGSVPTTVMGIELTHPSKKNTAKIITTQMAFDVLGGKSFPCVLGVGEVFSCRVPADRYERFMEMGTPEFHLSMSHKTKPLVFRASKSANNKFKSDSQRLAS